MKLNKTIVFVNRILDSFHSRVYFPLGELPAFRSFSFQEYYKQADKDKICDDKGPHQMIGSVWFHLFEILEQNRIYPGKNQNSYPFRDQLGARTDQEGTFEGNGNIYLDRDFDFAEINLIKSQRMYI